MSTATLSIDLVAKLATFERDLNRAAGSAEKAAKQMESAFDGVKDSIRHVIEGFVSFETIKFGVELIQTSIEMQAHLVQLSRALQISVEDVGALGFAMKQSGGDAGTIESAIARLNVTIGKAVSGDAKAAAPFQAMGIELKNAKGDVIGTEEALLKLSERFSSYRDDAKKTALAQAELGRGYKEMLSFLDQGPAEIQKQIDFFQRWSGVTSESAQRSHDLETALGQLHLMTQGLINSVANQLEPTFTALVTAFLDSKTSGDNLKSVVEEIGPAFARMAIAILESVKDASISMTQLLDSGERIQNFFRIMGDPRNFNWRGSLSDFFASMHKQFDDADKQQAVQTANAEDRTRRLQAVIDRMQASIKAANTPASAGSAADFFNTPAATRLNNLPNTTGPSAPNLPDEGKLKEVAGAIEAMNKRLAEQAEAVFRQEDAWRTLHRVQAELANDAKLAAAPEKIKEAWTDAAVGIDRNIQALKRWEETNAFVAKEEEELQHALDAASDAFKKLKDSTPDREIFLLNLELEKLVANFEHGTLSANDLIAMSRKLSGIHLVEDQTQQQVAAEVALRARFAAIAQVQGDSVELQRQMNEEIKALYGLPPIAPPALDAIHIEILKLADTLNSALGEGLTDLLEGKFSDIGKAFKKMIEQMIVQATQAQLMDKLLGESLGGVRQGGGWLDALFGFAKQTFTGSSGGTSGAIAGAGAGSAGDWFPSSAPLVSNTFHIAAGVTRNELAALVPQMNQQVTASVLSTMRRPGFSGA